MSGILAPEFVRGVRRAAQLAQAAPNLARLMTAARQALEGDAEAAEYVRANWHDGLELVAPGLGRAIGTILTEGRAAVETFASGREGAFADVVDGEYREVYPWDRAAQWIAGQRWGGWVIVGPEGSAKTTLALRLAEVWHRRTGYPVELVNFYPEDCPPFADRLSLGELADRVDRVGQYVDPEPLDEGEDEDDPEPADRREPSIERDKRRIIVLDESSLYMRSSGTDEGRRLARFCLTQGRHLLWNALYIGQVTKQLPTDLLRCKGVFVKEPQGDELQVDRDEPLIRGLWQNAERSFRELRSPRGADWRDLYPDRRSWAHVRIRRMGGRPGYEGLLPFRLPGSDQDAEEITTIEEEAQQ